MLLLHNKAAGIFSTTMPIPTVTGTPILCVKIDNSVAIPVKPPGSRFTGCKKVRIAAA